MNLTLEKHFKKSINYKNDKLYTENLCKTKRLLSCKDNSLIKQETYVKISAKFIK